MPAVKNHPEPPSHLDMMMWQATPIQSNLKIRKCPEVTKPNQRVPQSQQGHLIPGQDLQLSHPLQKLEGYACSASSQSLLRENW